MNIIYAANDGYARHLGVSLLSLLDHNRDMDEIVIYLLSAGMSGENQNYLKQIARDYNRELVAVEMGDLKEKFTVPPDTRGFDISTMSRLFAAEALPETVTKAIYLDCDTVIIGSLKPLWELPLGKNLVGMSLEPTAYEKIRTEIGLTMDDAYYNAGVLVIDLAGWRREQVQQKLLQFYADKGGNLFACDQDVINGTLKGRIKTFPPQFNFPTNYWYFRYTTLRKLSASYKQITPVQFEAAKKRPAVIHYMGDERPWIAGNRNRFRKYYNVYLSRTPWRGTPKETGKELYMLIYHWMNIATLICPPLRLFISRHFGMQVIDSRKNRKESRGGKG